MRRPAERRPSSPAAGRPSAPVRRYLRLWQDGDRPDLEAFLEHEEDLEPAELAAVLRADQRNRWRAGDPVPAEWYLERFPAVSDDPELALDLIHNEFLLREAARGGARARANSSRGSRGSPRRSGCRSAFHQRPRVRLRAGAGRQDAANGTTRCPRRDGPPARRAIRPGPMASPLIPGYEVVRELGAGGMAVVYEAYQLGLKRRVALKMVLAGPRARPGALPPLPDRGRGRRVAAPSQHRRDPRDRRERGAPVLLDGAGRGRDAGPEDGPGPDVGQGGGPARRDPGPRHRTTRTSAGSSTATSSRRTCCSRPRACPRSPTSAWPRTWASDPLQTQSGTILGSPCYMSPEQASGNVREVGRTSDVYSLGAILYEMLTGVPPFRAETPLETLHKLLNEEPVRPTRLRPKVPRDLETICLKCLEKAPRRRYASAPELAEDLDRFLNFESIQARPVRAPERVWRWCRRKTSLAIAVGLAGAGGRDDDRPVDLPGRLSLSMPACGSRRRFAEGGVASRRQVDQMMAATELRPRPGDSASGATSPRACSGWSAG